MILDGITVLFDTTLMAVTVGALLLFAGSRRNGDRSLCIWGAGYLSAAFATILFTQRSKIDDIWTIDVANAALNLAYALFWTGARRFARQRTNPLLVAAGALVWLAACRIDAFHASTPARIILSSATASVYLVLTCWTLARLRERLPSKGPLIGVLALHALLFFIRIPAAIVAPPQSGIVVVVTPIFFAVALEGLFHLVASSILLVTMSKERSENGVQQLASIDALTGINNRRSFMEQASRQLAEAASRRQPVTILMIDIDHFKTINDSRGHGGGDEVLQAFAALMREKLRPSDLCGRLGGEEFGCLLVNCDEANGSLIAERLRLAVTEAQPGVTVSLGVAAAPAEDPGSLSALILAADKALYASKDFGRNRVTLARAA